MAIRSLRRTALRALIPLQSSFSIPATQSSSLFSPSNYSAEPSTSAGYFRPNFSFNRISCRRLSSLSEEGSHGPAAINYCDDEMMMKAAELWIELARNVRASRSLNPPTKKKRRAAHRHCKNASKRLVAVADDFAESSSSVMTEDEYHKLANSTISELLEKLEEYGDTVDIDGFDVDYGNEVLTLKLGDLGTYVINKQSPNRQIWMSSPVSGPSRFDWDQNAEAWIYRRTKQNLAKVLETELEKLCAKPINLS